MQPSLEKLRKFFRLEHEYGYANSAIIGGLAKMLDYWEGEARADGTQEEVIQAVLQRLRSYDGLSPQSRADVLKGSWKRIGETYPEAQQKPRGVPSRHPATIGSPEPVEVKVEGVQERARPPAAQPQPPVSQPETRQKQEYRARPPAPPRSESIAGAKTSATPAALDAKRSEERRVGKECRTRR